MKKPAIDTDWFLARLKERDLSVRELASRLKNRQGAPLDRGNLWRLLHGTTTREMTVREASEIAEALGIPLETVVRHALGKKR